MNWAMAFAESFTFLEDIVKFLSFCRDHDDTFFALQFVPIIVFVIIHHFFVEFLPPIGEMAMLAHIRLNVIRIITFTATSFTHKLCILASVVVSLCF